MDSTVDVGSECRVSFSTRGAKSHSAPPSQCVRPGPVPGHTGSPVHVALRITGAKETAFPLKEKQ